MNLLIALVLNALALLITAYIVPGFSVDNFVSALLAAIVIGFVNTFVRPFLSMLTAPINMLTLGLFSFVVNAVMLYLAAFIVPGFSIDGAFAAILGALVLAVVAAILSGLASEVGKTSKRKK